MKKILSILIICNILLIQAVMGQTTTAAPGMNYQAVARDAFGKLLANQNISLKLSCLAACGALPNTIGRMETTMK